VNDVRPRRSALYVPGANARALEKVPGLDADVIVVDLEDAVAPAAKEEARRAAVAAIRRGLGRAEVVLRVNGAGTPWAEADLAAAAGSGADAVLLPADDGGHSAVGSLAGLLHGAGALVHEAKSSFKIKSPRSGVGGEFTQRQSGGGVEFERGEFFLQHREAGESVDIQSRLANRGFGQLLGRPLERDPAEWIPKNRVGFFEQRGGGGKFGGEVLAHANGLGALAGEEKCGFFHREMGFNAIRRGCSCRPAGCQ